MQERSRTTLGIGTLAAMLFIPLFAFAAIEPQATFKVEDGWIALTLRKEGQPIGDAEVRVIDERGGVFATGQTGAEGESSFPMPPGKSFLLEVKTGERVSDPIRIWKTGEGVEPARVLLSFGLKPCCRNVFAKQSEENADVAEPIQIDDPPSTWVFVAAEAALFLVAAAVCSVSFRPSHSLDRKPR